MILCKIMLKSRLDNLNKEKAEYFGNIVKKLNNGSEINSFNLTFDIQKRTEKIVKKVLDNMMFSFIYDYVKLYESNRDTFINSTLNMINEKK